MYLFRTQFIIICLAIAQPEIYEAFSLNLFEQNEASKGLASDLNIIDSDISTSDFENQMGTFVKPEVRNMTNRETSSGSDARNCSCGVRNAGDNRSPRIVDGVPTQSGEIPWRAAMYIFRKNSPRRGSICGGTIISPSWILTAAHCTREIKPGTHEISVYVGAQANPVSSEGGTSVTVDRFVQHPSYTRRNFDNDIALIRLKTPLKFNSNVAPCCLPFGSLAESNFQGARVLASGWGTTKPVPVNTENRDSTSNTLRQVELPVLTTEQCSRYQKITRNQICTYQEGKDTCQGDSGGSIDFKHTNGFYYSIGVVSFGKGCAQRNHPGVYTKVNNYLSWIEQTTGESYCKL